MRKRAYTQQSQKRLFSWLLSLAGVSMVLAGVIWGAVFLHMHSGGAHAAGAASAISFDADPLTGMPVVSSAVIPAETVLIPN